VSFYHWFIVGHNEGQRDSLFSTIKIMLINFTKKQEEN